ncbi:hypothetical protein J437_LFUL009392 [Ladona fulva]|uniref:Uncharacterized protein n=1 Tax=Ladona fulva TaxID=123851 RepID=A0A8K0NY34_LADFU|nr:hypothetical protein J437_LFUL009392 [Ladona fulva]
MNWGYVSTNENPADILSRGASPEQIIQSPLWYIGPTWLQKEDADWPIPMRDNDQAGNLEGKDFEIIS